jgi:hypothetical protein
MTPFIESVIQWATLTGGHFILMFWWIWGAAVVLTAVSESFLIRGRLHSLLEHPDDGWSTVWRAIVLGVISPPSRSRMFGQAKELLSHGVSPAGVMTYLVSAQTLFLWLLVFIIELDGPQLVIGQVVAVAATLAVLLHGLQRTPERLWSTARENAARDSDGTIKAPIARGGPVWARVPMSVAGQGLSLWWPVVFGLLGVGFFLALGQSSAYVSLQGSKGPIVQVGNAVVGLLLAFVTGAPLVGNALFAAGLWKPEFITYAGLSAFFLGTMVMPFVLPRYVQLLGADLSKQVVAWLVVALLTGALVATAWWWGLDWLAGTVGLRELIEGWIGSTLRPNDVPWFHQWFQS